MYFQISLGSQCLLSLLLHQTSFIGTFYVLFPIYIYCLEKKICNAVLLWSFGNVAQGHHLAQLVQWASHEQRLCPHCSAPMFKSRPGVLCCVSLPRSLILFPVMSQYVLSIKSYQDHKTFFFFFFFFFKKCYSVYKTRLSTGMGIGR